MKTKILAILFLATIMVGCKEKEDIEIGEKDVIETITQDMYDNPEDWEKSKYSKFSYSNDDICVIFHRRGQENINLMSSGADLPKSFTVGGIIFCPRIDPLFDDPNNKTIRKAIEHLARWNKKKEMEKLINNFN